MSSESTARAFPFPLSVLSPLFGPDLGGSLEVERADEMMAGASWKSGLNTQGIAWPPELSAGSKLEDNEGIISHPTRNGQPKGCGPSDDNRRTTSVSSKSPEPCPDYQRKSGDTI